MFNASLHVDETTPMINPTVLQKLSRDRRQKELSRFSWKTGYRIHTTALRCCTALPDAIVIPQTKEQMSAFSRWQMKNILRWFRAAPGSGLSGGSIPVENSIVMLMSHWNKILEVDTENLTVLVEPGVITSDIHTAVEKLGLFYPPDPGSMNICTIGGNVAENAGGLRGLKYGVTKNYVLGLETVLPNGEIIFSGGKVVKDVAGYNLKDFFVGSEGTLGVFTKILLKLIPKPEPSKTMLAYFQISE